MHSNKGELCYITYRVCHTLYPFLLTFSIFLNFFLFENIQKHISIFKQFSETFGELFFIEIEENAVNCRAKNRLKLPENSFGVHVI